MGVRVGWGDGRCCYFPPQDQVPLSDFLPAGVLTAGTRYGRPHIVAAIRVRAERGGFAELAGRKKHEHRLRNIVG